MGNAGRSEEYIADLEKELARAHELNVAIRQMICDTRDHKLIFRMNKLVAKFNRKHFRTGHYGKMTIERDCWNDNSKKP